MRFGVTELEWLLQHELDGAQRYRRYVSIAFFSNNNGRRSFFDPLDMGPAGALQKTVRSTDAIFHCSPDRGAVVLSETSVEGACKAIERWIAEQKDDVDFRFGLASFPEMNGSAAELMSSALGRLKRAERNSANYLVCEDELGDQHTPGQPCQDSGREDQGFQPRQGL